MTRAEAMRALGDRAGERRALEQARAAAEEAEASLLGARATAALAQTLEEEDPSRAADLFREAARVASEAGDAESANGWQRRGQVSQRAAG